ncbi:MAG: DUF211 domain-containing protein [Candidatus Nanohaloarchaea archaeon]|nr:DUF211 domain-containing protein [Candidatus Nanohaloarchaea archaeon]
MARIRRIVLDVLKPHEPKMLEMAEKISELNSVDSINATLYEVDESVENVKLTIQADNIDFGEVVSQIEELGGSIHSVDEAVCGEQLIGEVDTPQG